MSHFTDIELHRWRESGPGQERTRVIEHVASCGDCASRYAAALRNRPLTAEAVGDVSDFAAAGLRVPRRRRGTWAPLLTAAAAAVIVLLAVPLAMRRERTPDLNLRGSGIHTIAPSGDISGDEIEFAWTSGVAAPRYLVTIGQDEHVVSTFTTTESRVTVTPRLQRGVEYWWTVAARDAGGQTFAVSPRRTFRLRK